GGNDRLNQRLEGLELRPREYFELRRCIRLLDASEREHPFLGPRRQRRDCAETRAERSECGPPADCSRLGLFGLVHAHIMRRGRGACQDIEAEAAAYVRMGSTL